MEVTVMYRMHGLNRLRSIVAAAVFVSWFVAGGTCMAHGTSAAPAGVVESVRAERPPVVGVSPMLFEVVQGQLATYGRIVGGWTPASSSSSACLVGDIQEGDSGSGGPGASRGGWLDVLTPLGRQTPSARPEYVDPDVNVSSLRSLEISPDGPSSYACI